MSPRIRQSVPVVILGISAVAVMAIGIYMAQPWGDNYAYQDARSYWELCLILVFAISPYIALALCAKLFAKSEGASRLFLICSLLIGIAGLAAYIDAAFIHVDAQGGLIFLFLPMVQLAAGFALVVACGLWLWLARMRRETR